MPNVSSSLLAPRPTTTSDDAAATVQPGDGLKVNAAWLSHARLFDDVRVIDTRSSNDYLSGHVPGAVNFSLHALLVENTSRLALDALAAAARQALAARGVRPSDHVIVVDALDGSAALGLAILELAGMQKVSLLGGGVEGWRAAGFDLDYLPASTAREAKPAAAVVVTDAIAATPTAQAAPIVTASLRHIACFEDVVAAATTGTAQLVDVRSQLEHEGIVGSPCCPSRGHIPTSLHLEWTALIDHAGRLHTTERTTEMARHIGIGPSDNIILYCHSAHRAAVASLALRVAGFTNVRLALGSWHEWSSRGLDAQ